MDKINIVSSRAVLEMSSFSTDTRLMSSSPLVNSLIKNRFYTTPDMDEPLFHFIHTMDLFVVDMMLHDSPDLVVHRTEIFTVWRPQVGHKKVWHFLTQQFNCCTCAVRRVLHCPAATQSSYQILYILLAATRRREAAPKKSLRDITRISCFVTMKLPHTLHIYSTVFVMYELHF